MLPYMAGPRSSTLSAGASRPMSKAAEDEFGAEPATLENPSSGTWTLVVLSGLKQTGRELKTGNSSPHAGGGTAIRQRNGHKPERGSPRVIKGRCSSSTARVIGQRFKPDFIEIEDEAPDRDQSTPGKNAPEKPGAVRIPVTSQLTPVPHVNIPGIGRITGRVWLFENEISGGKSDERGASNGFHVNVLGRVVNQSDPSFGERNLSHAAWARFRMAVRADGLNEYLATDREKFLERQPLKFSGPSFGVRSTMHGTLSTAIRLLPCLMVVMC